MVRPKLRKVALKTCSRPDDLPRPSTAQSLRRGFHSRARRLRRGRRRAKPNRDQADRVPAAAAPDRAAGPSAQAPRARRVGAAPPLGRPRRTREGHRSSSARSRSSGLRSLPPRGPPARGRSSPRLQCMPVLAALAGVSPTSRAHPRRTPAAAEREARARGEKPVPGTEPTPRRTVLGQSPSVATRDMAAADGSRLTPRARRFATPPPGGAFPATKAIERSRLSRSRRSRVAVDPSDGRPRRTPGRPNGSNFDAPTSRFGDGAWHRVLVPSNGRGPAVVAVLEPVEDVDEQLEPVAVDEAGARPRRLADVDADPERRRARRASARMPATFFPSRRTSFGSLIVAPAPIAPATACGGDERQLGPAGDGRRRVEDDREREPGARLVDPDPPEPAAAGGLVLGERDRRRAGRRRAASSGSTASRPRRGTVRPKAPRSRGRTARARGPWPLE